MAKNSRTKNTALNLVSSFGGQMLTTVLNFAVRTVFIYTLGKSYLGINGLFSNILSMLSLTNLGVATAMNYRLYKPLAERDEKRIRVLMKFYRQIYTAIGLIILTLGCCMMPFLHIFIKDYDKLPALGINPILIFSLYLGNTVCSYLFFAYRAAIVRADQKTYILEVVDYAINIGSAAVQILVLLLTKNFIVSTATGVAESIIRSLVNATIANRMYGYAFAPEKDKLGWDEIKGLFKDCGALFVYKLNGFVLKSTDNIVLSSFIGLAIVGIYSNYLIFYHTITRLLSRIYASTRASMGSLFAEANIAKKYQFFEAMNFISIVFYGTACVGVAVVSNELVDAWIGDSYVLPQPFSVLMGIEILFVGLKNNLGQMRTVTGAFRQMWTRPILSIFVNLGVSIALVQKLGINGVLIGTIAADFLTNFMVDPGVIHKYSFNNYKPVSYYYRKNLIYIALLFAVGAVDMWLCSFVLTGMGWISVIVHTIICGISVPAVFVAIYHKKPEAQYLFNKVNAIYNSVLKRGKKR